MHLFIVWVAFIIWAVSFGISLADERNQKTFLYGVISLYALGDLLTAYAK